MKAFLSALSLVLLTIAWTSWSQNVCNTGSLIQTEANPQGISTGNTGDPTIGVNFPYCQFLNGERTCCVSSAVQTFNTQNSQNVQKVINNLTTIDKNLYDIASSISIVYGKAMQFIRNTNTMLDNLFTKTLVSTLTSINGDALATKNNLTLLVKRAMVRFIAPIFKPMLTEQADYTFINNYIDNLPFSALIELGEYTIEKLMKRREITQNYQIARSNCLSRIHNLWGQIRCAACIPPNSSGFSSGNITLSQHVCNKLQESCYPYLVKREVLGAYAIQQNKKDMQTYIS